MVNTCVTRIIAGLAVAAVALFGFLEPAPAQTYEGRELVRAELIADTSAAVPGKAFTVGVLLHMAEGWHTYWKFPGDAGIPTETKWTLPAGWSVGEIQWPIPLKLTEPGDIQIYGYHGDVLLMQQVTVPADQAPGDVTLAADANWLVCEKICIPGGAKLQVTLPVAQQSTPANEEVFARFRAQVPQPAPDANVARLSWARDGGQLALTVASAALANYPVADFYPLPEGNTVVGHPVAQRKSDAVTFRIPIESDAKLARMDGIVVFGPEENGANRNAWQLAAGAQASNATAAPAAPAAQFSGGLAKFLLFGFLGGFILNLMPCVLPVISLKIFGFVQQAGQSRRRIFRTGLSFAAGIFAWFIGLALLLVALKSAGREITWAFQFTSPAFVVGMSVVVLVFALNLFGVFEITLPQTASRRVLGLTEREGYAGSFFQGVFATILATPCTAPFLGTALGFAFTQSGLVIVTMFVAIAAGMSLPYVLLSAQPAWLRLLPKPGVWMVHVKQVMGFLLLATLLFLLWVLGAERGTEGVIWTSAFLLCVSLACWIWGTFMTPVASGRARLVSVAVALAIVAASGWYFLGEKFAETQTVQPGNQARSDWQPFTPERVATERANGKAVFVDFTAAWCLSCKFNETAVLESTVVREAFARAGVVKLKADWTNADPTITKILKQFGRPGVPLYVLYPAGASKEPIVFPELLTKGMVLEKLDSLQKNIAAQNL